MKLNSFALVALLAGQGYALVAKLTDKVVDKLPIKPPVTPEPENEFLSFPKGDFPKGAWSDIREYPVSLEELGTYTADVNVKLLSPNPAAHPFGRPKSLAGKLIKITRKTALERRRNERAFAGTYHCYGSGTDIDLFTIHHFLTEFCWNLRARRFPRYTYAEQTLWVPGGAPEGRTIIFKYYHHDYSGGPWLFQYEYCTIALAAMLDKCKFQKKQWIVSRGVESQNFEMFGPPFGNAWFWGRVDPQYKGK